jgi:hypothetical protein
MFYKTGVDITNDKQMFNFLKNHFEYYTMNSWNRARSVANNVKLYNLGLSGDWCVAYNMLANGEYDTISDMLKLWADLHPQFEVNFNGRSGGYLVLCNHDNNYNILPEEIVCCDDYDDYKCWCRDVFGSVRANRENLVYYTKLVQDFDRLCDQLRDFCDELSKQTFEIVEMQKAVNDFNDRYDDDLAFLDFDYLHCNNDGSVDVSEILALTSLTEAFCRLANRAADYGYKLDWSEPGKVRLVK